MAVSGSAFVLTGDFAHDRDKVKNFITAKGGRCTASVSGKTNYLVLGSHGNFGMKTIERAQEFQKKGKDIKTLETAELMGKNPSTVRTWLVQARGRLKELLEAENV